MFVDDVSLLNSIDVLYVANHGFSATVNVPNKAIVILEKEES